MVEQTRRPSRVISLQAGPGGVGTPFDVNFRIDDRAARAFGRQLAVIGDQFNQEWTSRHHNWRPTALHMLRPAQALTRTIYRDIHNQIRDLQGLSAAVKAWIDSTASGQRIFRTEAWATWVSSFKPVTCTDWTRGALVTMALVAVVTLCSALWVERNA